MALRLIRLCPHENQLTPHLIHEDETGILAWCQSCHRVVAVTGDSASAYRAAMTELRPFPPFMPSLLRIRDK